MFALAGILLPKSPSLGRLARAKAQDFSPGGARGAESRNHRAPGTPTNASPRERPRLRLAPCAPAAASFAAALTRIAKGYIPLTASAGVLVLATHPGSHPLLGMVGLIPLFWIIHSAAPATALRRGAAWGAALGIGLLLLPAGASTGIRDPLTGDVARSPALLLMLPMIGGAYAGLGARLTRWIGFSPFVLAVGWIGVELALAVLGAKLGILAATQGDGWIMNSLGRVLGFGVIAFIVAFTNAVICSLIRRMIKPVESEHAPRQVFVNAACPLASGLVASYLLTVKPARAPPSLSARQPSI